MNPEIQITEAEFRKLPIKEQNVVIFRSITTNKDKMERIDRTVKTHTYLLGVLSTGFGFLLATLIQHFMK